MAKALGARERSNVLTRGNPAYALEAAQKRLRDLALFRYGWAVRSRRRGTPFCDKEHIAHFQAPKLRHKRAIFRSRASAGFVKDAASAHGSFPSLRRYVKGCPLVL